MDTTDIKNLNISSRITSLVSGVATIFAIITTSVLAGGAFNKYFLSLNGFWCILFHFVALTFIVIFMFFLFWWVADWFSKWLDFQKDWVTAFNHAWDKNLDIRCIVDGSYVHIDKNQEKGFFYSTCIKCKHAKSLISDDGSYVNPLQARKFIKNHLGDI